ncbi:MAG: hypothetical protein QXY49_06015 [Thermofilaceae archaeon]
MPGSERFFIERRDPQGFYIVIAKKEALDTLAEFEGVIVEEIGDAVALKTKSRRTAFKLSIFLSSKGLLVKSSRSK